MALLIVAVKFDTLWHYHADALTLCSLLCPCDLLPLCAATYAGPAVSLYG